MSTIPRGYLRIRACLFVIGLSATPAGADVVTDWNLIVTQAIVSVARPGPSGVIDLAMAQIAMHDAMQAFQGRFELYGGPIANPCGSPIAAVAKASRDVLIGVGLTTTPDGSVDTLYQNYLMAHSLVGDPGISVGQQAAANILNLRVNNDGRVPANAEQLFGGTAPGDWRPTSFFPNGQPQPMTAAYLRHVLPFTLMDPSQFRQEPPPKLSSGLYARDYNEVKSLGGLTGSARTPEQTEVALFFADYSIQYWNRTLRTIAGDYLTDSGISRACLRWSTWPWPMR